MSGTDAGTFEVDTPFLFVGRTFEEYLSLFGLEPSALTAGPVLDCPGGPSSFTAGAAAMGATVTAVDPMYAHSRGELTETSLDDIEETITQLHAKRDLFEWDYYGDVETREHYLRAAARRFLADFERHPGRYVTAGLPELPFPDGHFSLTLSANLLFLYDDRLDLAFHEAALRELLRVTSGEVRLFPLASLDRSRSAYVSELVERLRNDGVRAHFLDVAYEFQPGVQTVLVLEA